MVLRGRDLSHRNAFFCSIFFLFHTTNLANAVINSNPPGGGAQNAALERRYPDRQQPEKTYSSGNAQQTRSAPSAIGTNWEGSGANPDDEDGDVDEEGSGDGPPVEGSGIPPNEEAQHPPQAAVNVPKTAAERPREGGGGAVRRPGEVPVEERVTDGIGHFAKNQNTTTLLADSSAVSRSGSIGVGQTPTTTTPSTDLFGGTTLRAPPATTSTMAPPKAQTTAKAQPMPEVKWKPPAMSSTPPATTTFFTLRTTRRPFFIADPGGTLEQLRPGIFAFMVGGVVVGLLLLILIISYLVYRLKKRDEGTYICEEPHQQAHYSYAYQKASIREFYA